MKDEKLIERFQNALTGLCPRISEPLRRLPEPIQREAQEIRLRVGKPVTVCCRTGTYFLREDGSPFPLPQGPLFLARKADLEESFRTICCYSVYSHQNEIRNGYITLRGGHRAGICGTAVYTGGALSGLRDVSSINLRIARQIDGAADGLFEALGGAPAQGVLLVGPPACGKTTLLRDMARRLSVGTLGAFYKVAVVDERSELGGTYAGISQNDLGYCDVLDGYPKGEGILQAVRCLSPDYIICDEVGSMEDIRSISEGLNAGVRMIASIHAGSLGELLQRSQAKRLLETGAFQKVALLGDRRSPGSVQGIYKVGELNAEMDRLGIAYRCGDRRGDCGVA